MEEDRLNKAFEFALSIKKSNLANIVQYYDISY